MEKREIGFRKEEGSEDRIIILHEQGQTLKEEMARLTKLGLDAESIVFDCYLDQFDIRIAGRGRSMLKGTKTKPPMLKAEVVKILTDWEPSVGRQRLTDEEKAEAVYNKMTPAQRAFIAKLQAAEQKKK